MDGGSGVGAEAGGSAYEEAARSRRHAEKNRADAARLTEDAARLTAQAADASRKAGFLEQRGHSFAVGGDGEIVTGLVLDSMTSEGWVALHDVRWPGRPRANIDHVAVGPGGIVVIDTKNWSGRVDVREEALRQNGHRREREVAAAAEAAIAVIAVLPADLHAMVRPVICLARDEPVEAAARDVHVTSTASLATYLRALPPVLPVGGVMRAARELELRLRPRSAPTTGAALAHPAPPSKAVRPRSRRRVHGPQPATRKTSSRRRQPKRNQKSVIPAVLVVVVFLVYAKFPATFAPALEWLAEAIGGVAADAIIPEPSTSPSPNPTPSSR